MLFRKRPEREYGSLLVRDELPEPRHACRWSFPCIEHIFLPLKASVSLTSSSSQNAALRQVTRRLWRACPFLDGRVTDDRKHHSCCFANVSHAHCRLLHFLIWVNVCASHNTGNHRSSLDLICRLKTCYMTLGSTSLESIQVKLFQNKTWCQRLQ